MFENSKGQKRIIGTAETNDEAFKVINDFLTDHNYKSYYEIAKRYFNNCCANGCLNSKKKPLKVKDKTTLAMNLKMNGRNTNKIYCKKCLMKELGMSKEEWDNIVADFKAQGCKLF